MAIWPLVTVTVGLMAVSLVHLSDGIDGITGISAWQSWSMAIGIDYLLIPVSLAQLTAPADVRRDIGSVAHAMESVTLLMSCGLNANAFCGGHWNWTTGPASCSGAPCGHDQRFDLSPGGAHEGLTPVPGARPPGCPDGRKKIVVACILSALAAVSYFPARPSPRRRAPPAGVPIPAGRRVYHVLPFTSA